MKQSKWPILLLYCTLSFTVSTCNQNKSSESTLFNTVPSSLSNITFSNQLTETEDFNIIEYLYFYNGGGVSLGDINNDGLLDIYITGNQVSNKLYLNKGNWQFEDITLKAGVASPGEWKTGVTMVDINGDGLLDIYQCRLGNYKGIKGENELFINQGNLTFTEEAERYGLNFSGFSTQSAFLDYDLDGDLDMYLLNHSVHTEHRLNEASKRNFDDALAGDRFFENIDNTFYPVTNSSGIYSSQLGYGLGIGVSDVNNDGWPDIYISNDFSENDYLYLNNKNKSFTEVLRQSIKHTSRFSMGNDLADYNNDGYIDIVSLDMLPEDEVVIKKSAGEDAYNTYKLKLSLGFGRQFSKNALQLNLGLDENNIPQFAEIAHLAGIAATDWSWASLLADFDNDGWKDLFISNGIQRRPNDMDYINFLASEEMVNNRDVSDKKLYGQMPNGEVSNYFFKNNKDLTFKNVTKNWGINTNSISNGAAYGDLDNDGDLDLVINNINQEATLLNNQSRNTPLSAKNSFINIHFNGLNQNTKGVGAKALVYHDGKMKVQENYPSRGFQSSVPPFIQMGLGDLKEIDSLRVIWPGGKTKLWENIPVNQTLTVNEKDLTELYSYQIPNGIVPYFSTSDDIEFVHKENEFNDFDIAYLLPHKYSTLGPGIAVADVNGDQLEDFYITKAKNGSGGLFFQTKNGKLQRQEQAVFSSFKESEETNVHFFDANKDGFQDLYIGMSGSEWPEGHKNLRDRLLINDGKGNFKDESFRLPAFFQHTGAITSADFDKDGDEDLFIGNHFISGKYGFSSQSYLLINDGKGYFSSLSGKKGVEVSGMVTDAKWVDLDGDSWLDLLIVGEWMPIRIFKNEQGILNEIKNTSLENTSGWWQTIEITDADNDGDSDVILGNQGENTRHQPSKEFPMYLYVSDFDNNGTLDPLITYQSKKGIFPIHSRDELIKQIPSLKKKFVKHEDFAGKTISQILGAEMIRKSNRLEVTLFSSISLENIGNLNFNIKKLPKEAQFTPIYSILATDINGDNLPDLITGGNNEETAPYFGTYDAGRGLVLLGKGDANFSPLSAEKSGINISGQIRDIKKLNLQRTMHLIIGLNDDKALLYKLNPKK
ncbi:MAG: FG-GAP-like repeat-containing protein [Saprospiraceae bacterium]|nr:FG-GAP-like repeat-containing protein [Saprospiraceae bacterium]